MSFTAAQLLASLFAPLAALAFPIPADPVAGDTVAGESSAEIVGIEQDRAKRMTVPVRIEGQGPYNFVIDTGSERTVLSEMLAARLQLEGEEPAQVVSIAGEKTVDMVYVPELTLGARSYGGLIAPVMKAHHIGADGMIGLDSLQNQRVLFDFRDNVIAIEDAAVERPRSNAREIIVVARRKSGQLIFTDATIGGVAVNVVIDTGSEISVGNKLLQRRLMRRAEETGDDNLLIAVTGQTLGVDVGYARDFRIGKAQFSRMPMVFADAPPFARLGLDTKPALLLGMDVLREFDRFAIDFAARKIYLTLPRGVPLPAPRPFVPGEATRIKG